MPTDTHIMVVEDDAAVAACLRKVLENLGYRVAAPVASGQEAVEKAGETLPDLVLMDIALEGEMNGVEATRQIRNRFDIPVVYITQVADDALLRRANATRPSGYVTRPFEAKSLCIIIEVALFKRNFTWAGNPPSIGQPGEAGGQGA